MDTVKRYAIHLVWVLPVIAFLLAGGGKLSGNEGMHASFATMGLPWWFGYFIGAAEIAGAIGLCITALRKPAAAGLAIIMVGAIYFHIAYAVPSFVPALILLVLLIATMAINWRARAASYA